MEGLMMSGALSVPAILDHAARNFATQQVVSVEADGTRRTSTYHQVWKSSRQLASAIQALGLDVGDRLATLAWNTARHLEIYYGVPGMGGIVHTLNPRLTPEMLAYMVEQAGDRVLFFDVEFMPLARSLVSLDVIEHFILLGSAEAAAAADWPGLLSYDELVGNAAPLNGWVALDEEQAAGLCYTSGTTGKPKGVLYSHRSTVLHALVSGLPTNLNLTERDCVVPVVPMFHVNAWGLPHLCPLVGAKLVLPRGQLDGASLEALFLAEEVTFAAGVPTLWQGLAEQLQRSGTALPALRDLAVGGAAMPGPLFDFFREKLGITMKQGWGMTETSPLCTYGTLGPDWDDAPAAKQRAQRLKQGRPLFGVELKLATQEDGEHAPGELLVRGPWIARRYFASEPAQDREWFATGDICEFDPHGYMTITDRAKDLIKSGGEWISSLELEELALGIAGVAQAAAIAVPDPKWGERPLLVVKRGEGAPVSADVIREAMAKSLASWQVPERIIFIEQMPIGPTGKILKTALREQFVSASGDS